MLPYFLLSASLQAICATQTPYVQIFLRNKGLSFSLVGVIVAIGQISSIIFPLLIGSIADKTGKTKLTIFSCCVFSGFMIVPVLLSKSVVLTMVCYGLMCATFNSLNPMVDGLLTSKTIGHPGHYSYLRATGTMTYVLVLLFYGIINWPDATSNKSILISILISYVFMIVCAFNVPDSKPKTKEEKKESKLFDPKWFGKSFYVLMIIVALSRITQTVPDKLLSSYMTEVLGIGNNFTVFYSLSAGSEFVLMIVGGKLLEKKKFSPEGLIAVSCLVSVLRMFVYKLFPTVAGLAIAQLFHSFTFGGIHIGTAAFINTHVDKEHYGMAMSFYWALACNLPMMLGALVGGYIIDIFGYPTLFVTYAIPSLIAFFIFLFCKKTLRSEA